VQDAEPTSVDAVVLREASAVAQRSEAPAGHINFWQQDELRMGNHEKKVRTLLAVCQLGVVVGNRHVARILCSS
jgi:hypothetical protein